MGQYVWVFQNVIPPKGTKKLLKKRRGPFLITEVHQQRRFYRLSTGRAAHYENLKPHIPSPEDWCVPNFMTKKLREVREKCGLELEGEEAEPTIGRNFKTKFEISNEYSENILITDSDFILSDRTSAICITADKSFKSRLEADFKREYQNVEFLFRQRPGLRGMAALPPSVVQVPGKYLCFLVTRVNDRNTIDPEHVMLTLTRLPDFMIERGITKVSMPVYDPNRGKLSPRELYAILHVVFAETEIMVHLHKK